MLASMNVKLVHSGRVDAERFEENDRAINVDTLCVDAV
jgi:hypothetical protein